MEWSTECNPIEDIENARGMLANPYYEQCYLLSGAIKELEWQMYCNFHIGKDNGKLKKRLDNLKNKLQKTQDNYNDYDKSKQ